MSVKICKVSHYNFFDAQSVVTTALTELIADTYPGEGNALRVAAISAICLLCKAAFVEADYQTAEAHVRAIATLVSDRLAEVPSFLWLFIVWADLRLTAVSYRAPALPFVLHRDFHVRLPAKISLRARALATFNAQLLPCTEAFPQELATILLEKLYSYTAAYCDDDVDWTAAWSVSYQTAYLLARMRNKVQTAQHKDSRHGCDKAQAFLLGAAIQFWGTMSTFVPQDGLQQHLLQELIASFSHRKPETLCEEWDAARCLDSYLWILFNAGASTVQQIRAAKAPSSGVMEWMRSSLRIVMERLAICTLAQFEKYLRRWPFAEGWNCGVCGLIFDWARGGSLQVTTVGQSSLKLFRELRLTFDIFEE